MSNIRVGDHKWPGRVYNLAQWMALENMKVDIKKHTHTHCISYYNKII